MTYGTHAWTYYDAGWRCILPVPPATKTPPPEYYTGEHGIDVVDPEVLSEWAVTRANYSIALRMPPGVIAIDIDHYNKVKTLPTGEAITVAKRGADTVAEYEARLGPLPPTWASTARGNDSAPGLSKTLFYRVPPGRYATTLGDPTTGAVEILQRHHRYCVVAPSINHDAGDAPYRWYRPDGTPGRDGEIPGPNELPELPDAWVAALSEGAARPSAMPAPIGQGAALLSVLLADDRPECADVTNIRLTTREEMESASAGSRHDTTTRRVYQLIRTGALGHTGCGTALEEIRNAWEALTAGENRCGEFDSMCLSAARKAVTEVATTTGVDAPARHDPCLMIQLVPAPRPGTPSDDDTDTPLLEIPVAAAPIVWSRRELIGTEAFDPRGLVDHKLAAQSLTRIRPVARYATDTAAWVVRNAYNWEITPGDLADWIITELYELMPDGDADSQSEEAKNRAARKAKFGASKSSAGVASKMRAMVRASGHPCTLRISEMDADPEILWAGRLPWNLRRCAGRPQLAMLPQDTAHLHSAGVAPSGLGIEHPTPHWDAFTAAVWPDPGIRQWALHVLSVALTGYADAVLPILWGNTGRGKTSIITLVMSLLGTYAIPADPRLLVSADNAHASIVFALKGARLAFIDEAPRRGELATARLKQLTGSGRLTGNPMRGNPVNFDPTHTLVLTCNPEETPNFADPALRRRLRLIPCEGAADLVAAARRAITRDVWTAEAPGVLAKLMHYTAEWLADPDTAAQYRAPESIRWRAEDIAAEEDPVRQWIDAEMEPCEIGTNATQLRMWFAEWLRRIEPRAPLMSATLFGRKLTELGYPHTKSHGTKNRPLRKRQSHYGPPVPPPQRPTTATGDLPPLVTAEDARHIADARGTSADAAGKQPPSATDQPQKHPGNTNDHAEAELTNNQDQTSTDSDSLSPEQPSVKITSDQPTDELTLQEQIGEKVNLASANGNTSNSNPMATGGRLNRPETADCLANRPEDQHTILPAITSTFVDVGGQLDSYSPILSLYRDDDLSTSKDHICVREVIPRPNCPLSPDDLCTSSEQGESDRGRFGAGDQPAGSPETIDSAIPLTEQQASTEAELSDLRGQRNQLTKLIKKTADADPLRDVYTYTKDQLTAQIRIAEKRLRAIRSEITKRETIAALGGPILDLPARKTRTGEAHSVTLEQAAAIVREAMTHRADPGRCTVDIESTGYPIGHPQHAVRTVQLGNRDDGVVFEVADPVQFAICVVLLAEATELEAYSAAVEISHLAHLGMLDYRDGWRRAHDVVIKAQLHNPVGTLSSDQGLKPQSELHLPDAVTPGAEAARSQLFRKAGWTTDTKVKNAGTDESGGWVEWERSGWAQVDPRCRTQVCYAVSDVHDCAALGETLPRPAAAVYERERAVQAAVGAVSYQGIRLDREHIEAKIAEHLPQRSAARRELLALGIDNPGSNDQVAAALLARGVTVGPQPGQLPLGKKSGKPSVAADVLARLPRTDALAPVLDTILTFRKHNRVLTTYLGPYHLLCTHGDGRMRSTVYTLQADTGRFSCVHENLQNIPTHGGIRECIISDEGDLFIDADLFGIEVAVLAALSQDPVLMELVASGRKLHKIIAEMVYGPNYTTRQYGYVKNGVFCVPLDTMILTKRGWLRHDQVQRGDATPGMVSDGTVQWTPILAVHRYQDAPLVRMNSGQWSVTVTPDHRWVTDHRRMKGHGVDAQRYVERGMTATDELTTEHTIVLGGRLDNTHTQCPVTPDEAALIAWSVTDGSVDCHVIDGSRAQGLDGRLQGINVRLYQSKPDGVAIIRKLIADLGILAYERQISVAYKRTMPGYVWTIPAAYSRQLYRRAGLMNTDGFNRDGLTKFVLSLDPDARSAFLMAAIQAEGWTDKHGIVSIGQNEGPVLEALALAAHLEGYYVRRYMREDPRGNRPNCILRLSKPRVTGQRRTQTTAGSGDVWCVTTGLGSWTMRQGDQIMLTGNCKLYGGGIWRLANTVGCSEAEAQHMANALDEFAPHARRWGYDLRNRVRAGMNSITLYSGRVLHLPADFPHKIVNYYVQGTAREILVDGILRWRQTKWGKQGLLVPVHDEQLISVPAAEAPEAIPTLLECMAGELYGVKIKAEPKWKDENKQPVPSDRWLSNDHPLAV